MALRWALVTFAKSERAELCDLFDKVGPHAPTLCEGWDTHDLAAHLWIRETDPVGASGIVAKPLSSLYERRMAEIKQRWEYAELVDRVRRRSGAILDLRDSRRRRRSEYHRVLHPP